MFFKERPTHIRVEAVREVIGQVAETSFENLGAIAARRIRRKTFTEIAENKTPPSELFLDNLAWFSS